MKPPYDQRPRWSAPIARTETPKFAPLPSHPQVRRSTFNAPSPAAGGGTGCALAPGPAEGGRAWGRCARVRKRDDKNEGDSKLTTHKNRNGRPMAMPTGPRFQGGHEAGQVGPQRLMFDDFPLRPEGRIPRATKSPPSAVLRLTLRPARASRVLARPARLPLSHTRGTDGMGRRPEETERGTKP